MGDELTTDDHKLSNGHADESRIVSMRDAGAPWNEIQRTFGLTRQQARYSYQRGKREQRRAKKRAGIWVSQED